MDAILLCEDKALIRVEPDDAFYPLNEFGILQVPDKLKILSLVEDQLQKFLWTTHIVNEVLTFSLIFMPLSSFFTVAAIEFLVP